MPSKTDTKGAATAPEAAGDTLASSQEGGSGAAATPIAAEGSGSPASSPASDMVERWFNTTFPGSVASGTTEQWNFLVRAKEELKKLLSNI